MRVIGLSGGVAVEAPCRDAGLGDPLLTKVEDRPGVFQEATPFKQELGSVRNAPRTSGTSEVNWVYRCPNFSQTVPGVLTVGGAAG